MLEVIERQVAVAADGIYAKLVLNHLQRERGRLKAQSSLDEEVGIFLERGQPLKIGELLKTRCGKVLQVEGAAEDVTQAANRR